MSRTISHVLYFSFFLLSFISLNAQTVNLALTRHFYPVSNLYLPKSMASGEIYNFSCLIRNYGEETVEGAYLKVQILRTEGAIEEWADSLLLTLEPIVENVLVIFPDSITFSPAGLEPGQYTIRYSVYVPGIPDYDPQDNVRTSNFFISDDNIWQTAELKEYTRPAFSPIEEETKAWLWGSFFFVPEQTMESFKVSRAEVSVAIESGVEFEDSSVNMAFFEILNDDFYGQNIQLNDGITHQYAAHGNFIFSKINDKQHISISLMDSVANSQFVLKPGNLYFGAIAVPEGFHIGYDDQYINYPLELWDASVKLSSRLFFNGFFQSTFQNVMPFIQLNLELTTSVDHKSLPEFAVTLFPNPAQHFANLDINLEKESNITITVAEISGKVVSFQNFSRVHQMLHSLDTSGLSGGTYLVRVSTNEGSATKKLMVIK